MNAVSKVDIGSTNEMAAGTGVSERLLHAPLAPSSTQPIRLLLLWVGLPWVRPRPARRAKAVFILKGAVCGLCGCVVWVGFGVGMSLNPGSID